jgi:predicted DsbA family dithiol-disulfide isomerase
MPRPEVEKMMSRVTAIAAEAGLDYHFDDVHQTKTLKAHELLHFAKEQGLQAEMKERLLSAYFVEGRHIGRIDDLVDIAGEVGLDAGAAREALDSGRFADAVAADIAQAQAYGIQGVPFFVLDGKYGVSGAQPAELFAQALQQVAGEREGVGA